MDLGPAGMCLFSNCSNLNERDRKPLTLKTMDNNNTLSNPK